MSVPAGRGGSVLMLLENMPYPQDVRVRAEAESLTAAGYAVTVVAPRAEGQRAREEVAGVRVRRFRLPQTSGAVSGILAEYLAAHLQLLPRALVGLLAGADVVHAHNPPDTLFPAGALARLLGRRFVFDNHDLFPDLFEEKFGRRARRAARILRVAQRASMRIANLVIVTNESQREVAELVRGRSDGIGVVRNGPRRATLPAAADGREGELRDPHLVFLGTIATQDGVFELPSLLRSLVDDHGLEAARLTMVGDGPSRADVERELAAADLADRVRVTGWVPHAEVPALLREADIGVDPAVCTPLNHKTTMIKIAEYMAVGLPVVAYRLRETERTAADAGLLVDCGDAAGLAGAVARLARSPELRRELAEHALARRDALVWEHSEVELLRAYGSL